MRQRITRTGSTRLTVLFLAVVVPPAVTLVWLGLRLLEQDRALAAQRAIERRDAALQTAAYSLEHSLAEAQRWFVEDTLPDGSVRFTLSGDDIRAYPPERVAWMPAPATLMPAATREFMDAEQAEFSGDSIPALAAYERLAASSTSAVRAGALLRIARVYRRQRTWDQALEAYWKLAVIDDVAIDGMPVDLVARRAINFVLEEAGRSDRLLREAGALERDLLAGRWTIDRAAWTLTAEQLARWTGRDVAVPSDARVLSAAAEWLWQARAIGRAATDRRAAGRRAVTIDGMPLLFIMHQADGGTLVALALLPAVVQAWLPRQPHEGSALTLIDDDGTVVGGEAIHSAGIRRSSSETGLPWTLAIRADDFTGAGDDWAGRRRLLATGLAAIVLLLAGGGVMLWRVVQQQLAVARLRTNFVSAVSHEFRTPLASLRHVTELLAESDALPAHERRAFYEVLARNTERLQRLVESLLDFSRMEEGRKPYEVQSIPAGTLVRQVVADFMRDGRTRDAAIEVRVDGTADVAIQVDPVAVGQALWNVLDNAVKYSPGRAVIEVTVTTEREGIAIGVRDQGIGIPSAEQQHIFGKFVRGEQAMHLGIKGTGLGLAIVSHIVQAHGGTVRVESGMGTGSAFVLVFPTAGAAAS